MYRRLLPLLILLPALACGPAGAAEALKTLTPAQQQALDIRTGTAQRAEYVPLDGLPARVGVPLADSAVVTAPYEGVVVELLAREGETVRRGQPIGLVGATGRASGPHLHWGMRWGSARIDPLLVAGPMPVAK